MNTEVKRIKLEGKTKKFSWFKEKFESNLLWLNGDTFNKGSFDKFRQAIKCVQEIYEDNWDIDINVYTDGGRETIDVIGIVILFEKITIKNKYGKSHLIEDLFVRIKLRKEGTNLRVNNVEGGRGSLSYAEWNFSYQHSHLRAIQVDRHTNFPIFQSFCLGSGHINDFIMDIRADGFTQTKFTSFLLQIISLVSWESIDGVPHIKFKNIRVSPSSGTRSRPSEQESLQLLDKILEFHKEENITPKINFTIEGNRFVLTENDNFNIFILESASLSEGEKNNILCTLGDGGVYYKKGLLPGYRAAPTTPKTYIFREKEINLKIGLPPTIESEREIKYIIHPEIIKKIKKKIENDINTKKIRKSTIDRYQDKINNARQDSESNPVAL